MLVYAHQIVKLGTLCSNKEIGPAKICQLFSLSNYQYAINLMITSPKYATYTQYHNIVTQVCIISQ